MAKPQRPGAHGGVVVDDHRHSLAALVESTGATYRQLDHWCRQGLLTVQSPGCGYARVWTGEEVAVAAVMARLVRAGLTPAAAAKVARGDSELAPGVHVLIDGGVR